MIARATASLASLLACCAVAATTPGAVRELVAAGQFAQAIGAARAWTEAAPEQPIAWQTLADVLTEVGELEQAWAAYQRIQPGRDGRPLDVEVALARIERLRGNVREARAREQRVVETYRARPDTLSASELRAAGSAARALASEDPALYRSALEIFERAIARDVNDPASHVAIGDLLLDRYNNAEAVAAYRAALAADEDFAPALLGLARSQHFDRSAGALDAARRALDAAPHSVSALVLLARLHLELEDYGQAEALLARARSINPASPEALTLSAALAFLRNDGNAYALAVSAAREHAPGYVTLYQTLAEIAAQNRHYAKAAEFALLAVNLDSSAWRSHALLGVNRLRLGKVGAARAALELAFRGDPFDPRTKNALELLDRLDDFETVRSPRFVLVADRREIRALAPRVLEIAEQAYDDFAQRYQHQPDVPIRIEFYRRHEDFSVRTTGLVGVDILGVSFGPVVALDSPSAAAPGALNYGSVLWHEIAHSFHLSLSGSRVPRWFSEGLAVYEERRARPGWGFDVTPAFLLAFSSGRLNPISRLNEAFLRPSYPEQIAHAYFQAAMLMEMIAQSHGFDAIVQMLRGFRDGRGAAELATEVLGTDPSALDASFEAYVRGRFGHAIEAVTSNSNGADADGGRYAMLLRAGRAALESGDLERALSTLSEAQALFPEHGGAQATQHLLATVHEQRGEPRLAIAQLERAIAIDADDLEAHRRLAALLAQAGEAEAAAEVLDRALLIQPFDPALHRTLAELLESRERWARAASAHEAVVALDPTDPAEARYRLALAYHRAGDQGAARREVLTALESAPLYEQALDLLLSIRDAVEDVGRDQGAPGPGEASTPEIANPTGDSGV